MNQYCCFTGARGGAVGWGTALQAETLEDGTGYVVPKRRYVITILRCVMSQKSADLIYVAAEAWSRTYYGVRGSGISIECGFKIVGRGVIARGPRMNMRSCHFRI